MQINILKRNTPRKKSKLVGRGGTRGKTSGRGHKGQKQHGGHGIRPDIRDRIKKLPKIRGRGVHFNTSRQRVAQVISLDEINTHFADGKFVTPASLFKAGLVNKDAGNLPRVKVLANGELKKKVIFKNVEISKKAQKMIESAGGQIKDMPIDNRYKEGDKGDIRRSDVKDSSKKESKTESKKAIKKVAKKSPKKTK